MENQAFQLLMALSLGILVTIALLWLADDENVPPAIADSRLRAKTPKPENHALPIACARTILEAFLSERREVLGDSQAAAESPMRITRAAIPGWLSNTIPLKHPITGWTIDYDGGPWATATATDGVKIQLDATRTYRRADSMLCMVVLETRQTHVIHVPARTTVVKSHYHTRGWGRFRHYKPTEENSGNASAIYNYFQELDTAS